MFCLTYQRSTDREEIFMKRRERIIFDVLKDLGGEATTKNIADKLGICTKGINQTLKEIKNIKCINGSGDQSKWEIISK